MISILGISTTLCIVDFLSGPHNWSNSMHLVIIERDFRGGQALFLTALLAATLYLGIPLGRNLTGLFLGYGLYIGAALVTLAIESRFPSSFVRAWYLWKSVAYGISLLIYLVSLWRYEPPPNIKDASEVATYTDELLASVAERLRLPQ